MNQPSCDGIEEYLDFGDSQQQYNNPIDNSTERDASQRDDPMVQTPRSLNPEPHTDSHTQ